VRELGAALTFVGPTETELSPGASCLDPVETKPTRPTLVDRASHAHETAVSDRYTRRFLSKRENSNGDLLPQARREVPAARCQVSILGTSIDILTGNQALSAIADADTSPLHVAFVNAHSLNLAYRNTEFGQSLRRCALVLNDGIGVSIAARMRRVRLPENLNGSDFTIQILRLAASKGWSVFLYGGYPGVAISASQELLRVIPDLNVVGTQDGYSIRTPSEVADDVRAAGADVVVVALGQPIQELWLDRYLVESGCHLGLGVGAFLDFISGRIERAPSWTNRIGLEWVVRLYHEPRRLWHRYLVGNPLFLWRAWRTHRPQSGPEQIFSDSRTGSRERAPLER
jgi:exopolysaccharide biosynthesis WecB/TagA/CpsF family protein